MVALERCFLYQDRTPDSRSLSGDNKLKCRFYNDCSFTIRLYWVNYKGGLVHYEDVESGKHHNMNTMETHPWFIVSLDEEIVLGLFIPNEETPRDAKVRFTQENIFVSEVKK